MARWATPPPWAWRGFFIWSIGCHLSRFPLALAIAPRVSVESQRHHAELLRRHYGKFTAVMGSIVLVVSCMSIAEVGATGYAGEAAWGLPAVVVSIVVVGVSIGITALGGLMGVAVTDMIFFVLMLTGVCCAFPVMYNNAGGMGRHEGSHRQHGAGALYRHRRPGASAGRGADSAVH